MKIAVVSEDGHTVSQHFGHAAHYVVLTAGDGVVTRRELRVKSAPHLAGGPEPAHPPTLPHGTDPASPARHD